MRGSKLSSKEHCHGCGKLWSEESPDCVFNYHKKSENVEKLRGLPIPKECVELNKLSMPYHEFLEQQIKKLEEELYSSKTFLADAQHHTEKISKELQKYKDVIEKIKYHHTHAGCNGHPDCHSCLINEILKELGDTK